MGAAAAEPGAAAMLRVFYAPYTAGLRRRYGVDHGQCRAASC